MVYELVWKNQRLNCFTHACSGIDTHTHALKNSIRSMHIKHTQMTVLLSPSTLIHPPAAISALQRKRCGSHFSQDSGFPFWIVAHAGADIYYILTVHQHTHTRIGTYTQAYKQKATKTNSGLHFSLQLQGIPSVNMT